MTYEIKNTVQAYEVRIMNKKFKLLDKKAKLIYKVIVI